MNKVLLALFILLVGIGTSHAATLALPLPVAGKLVGQNVAGQEVRVTNLGNGQSLTTTTSPQGEFLVDMANVPNDPPYQTGQVFKIEVTVCSAVSSACTTSVTYTGQTAIFVTMDLGTAIPAPVCPPQNDCHCGGGGGTYCSQEYAIEHGFCPEAECPEAPECPPPQIIYKDRECPEVPIPTCDPTECPSCPIPEEFNSGLIWTVSIIGIIVAAIGGFLVGRRK